MIMPEKLDNILSKLDKMSEVIIRMDEKLRTITERGCEQGHRMNEKTEKKVDNMQKMFTKIAAVTTAIGIGLGYWIKKI